MELNEFKDLTKGVKAPSVIGSGSRAPEGSLEGLIVMLKAEDAKDRRRAHGAMVFSGILGVVYLSIFTLTWILPPDGPVSLSRLVLALFTLLFLVIALIGRKSWRELSSTDYTEPATKYLDKTERRYRLFDTGELLLIVPVGLLLTVASGFACVSASSRYLPEVPQSTVLAGFGILWICVLVIAFEIRKRDWKKTKAPIWEALNRLKNELAKGEANPADG